MKKVGKEEVTTETFINGVLSSRLVEKKTVYKRRAFAGDVLNAPVYEECVHYVTGYRKIERRDGKAVLVVNVKKMTALTVDEIMSRLDER